MLLTTVGHAEDAITPGKFTIGDPTLICLGFEWDFAGDANDNARVDVLYREKGSEQWHRALPLLRTGGILHGASIKNAIEHNAVFEAPARFAGSIFDLKEGTEYEVKVTMNDPDGVTGTAEKVVTVSTRREPMPYKGGAVRHVYPGAEAAKGKGKDAYPDLWSAYTGKRADGSSAGPVKAGDRILIHAGTYNVNRWKADSGEQAFHGTYVFNQDGTEGKPIAIMAAGDGKVIFDGEGAYRLFDTTGADWHLFEGLIVRNAEIAFNGGDPTGGCTGLAVKNCRIEDVGLGVQGEHMSCRKFYVADNSLFGRQKTWYDNPEPSTAAIRINGSGHVVCFNYMEAFFDSMNFGYWNYTGGPKYRNSNVDVYNNYINWTDDNMITLNHFHNNGRVMRNLGIDCARQFMGGQAVIEGPAYFIRNIGFRAGNWKQDSNATGMIALHNSFIVPPRMKRGSLGAGGSSASTSLNALGADCTADSKDLPQFVKVSWSDDTDEIQKIVAKNPKYERWVKQVESLGFASFAPRKWDIDPRIKTDCPWVDKGKVLPNINDNFNGKAPDLGAIEAGNDMPRFGPRKASMNAADGVGTQESGFYTPPETTAPAMALRVSGRVTHATKNLPDHLPLPLTHFFDINKGEPEEEYIAPPRAKVPKNVPGPRKHDWYEKYYVRYPGANPGSSFIYHPGTYAGSRYIHWGNYLCFHGTYNWNERGTAEKPITYKTYRGGKVVFQGDQNPYRCINIAGGDHLIIDGFTIVGHDIGIFAGDGEYACKNLIVRNCTFKDVGVGIYNGYQGDCNITVEDCVFEGRHKEGADKDLSPAGIWLKGKRAPTMTNNTFTGFREEVRVGR
jgi:hypothetical protein